MNSGRLFFRAGWVLCFIALSACLMGAANGSAAKDMPDTSDIIRLHVIANSDSAEDQRIKLEVRDAVRALTMDLLQEAQSEDAAYQILIDNIPAIEQAAKRQAELSGHVGPVRAELGVFTFPDRMYGGQLVPAGEYQAMRVVLGEGEGKNWWCVLYPTLCVIEPDGGEAEQAAQPGEPIQFYSSVANWFRDMFSR